MTTIMGIDRLRMGTDGKGVTTLVAFYGCPLSCRYCLNPQCHEIPVDESLPTPEQLCAELAKDNLYFRMTEGGVTFGGGEPLLQSAYIATFAKLAPAEWKLRIETSLYVPWEYIEPLTERVDQWIIDIKDAEDEIYFRYTDCHNALVKENVRRLAELVGPEKLHIRVPHIPGYNTSEDVERSVAFYEKYGEVEVFEYLL